MRLLTSIGGLAIALAGQAQVNNPPPTREIQISSALKCGARKHLAARVHFSPDGTQLAFVLYGAENTQDTHLMIVSRDGTSVRELAQQLGQLPNFIGMPARMSIPWSSDGEYLALRGSPVSVVRVRDAKVCTIPAVNHLAGFVEGSSLVVQRFGTAGNRIVTLEYWSPDCELQGSVPAPANEAAVVLPGGTGIAFGTDKGILISDVRAVPLKEVTIDFRGIEKHADKKAYVRLDRGGFTENGAVLCAGIKLNTTQVLSGAHCIDMETGKEAGTRPPGMQALGDPIDTAEQGTRALWRFEASNARDALEYIPNILFRGVHWVPGWLIWDYRAASKILQLGPFRWSGWSDAPIALAPKGDAVAVVKDGAVVIWELP